MKQVIVLAEAAEDLGQGWEFYNKKEEGVGEYFLNSILVDIESLQLFHGIHSVHFGLHRLLATKFPFGIYYRDDPCVVRVIAVLDLRRDPIWIRNSLSNR